MKPIALAAMLGLLAFAPAQAQTITYLNINTGENDQAIMAEAGAEYIGRPPGRDGRVSGARERSVQVEADDLASIG